ncbi:MAG TPA: LrgB family protein [Candidatus Deferrimicrobium sp.]|nr:LrgB family protein [Candidatus Deferrimicrobium sp.]
MSILVVLFTIVITLASYIFSRYLNRKYPNPLVNVVFISTALIIIILLLSGISFAQYKPGSDIMTFFLGPATAALAIPLYRNREVLLKNILPVALGIMVGATANMISVVFLAKLFRLKADIIVPLVPKSVTVPIAVEITKILHGDPALAAAFVVATGTLGTVLTPLLLNMAKIKNPLARGLAYGTTAHGQGTATAMMEGEVQGAMSGVAMALAAIFTSFAAPLIVKLFL